jgi:DNA-binding NarL/FixJ family response regulator
MDIRMPHGDGITATREIAGLPNAPEVIVLTTFGLDEYVEQALVSGAAGFLLKDTRPPDLLAAVRTVARGDAVISPAVTRKLIDSLKVRTASVSAEDFARLDLLSPREREVLELVAQGLPNEDIAVALHMSLSTVKAHVSKLMTKLEAGNRVQVAIFAHQAGIPQSEG